MVFETIYGNECAIAIEQFTATYSVHNICIIFMIKMFGVKNIIWKKTKLALNKCGEGVGGFCIACF